MSKVPLSADHLRDKLAEQIGFLKRSCDMYDDGHEDEAKRIAVSLRILLHNSMNSHSLLHQLDELNRNFHDSALENETGMLTYSGLVFLHLGTLGPRYVAMLDDVPSYETRPFDDWWNRPILVDQNKSEISRRSLVLTCANQDGGAHVDHSLDANYHALTRENSLGWTKGNGQQFAPMDDPAPAAIRQIAHETLKSLDATYEKKIERDGMMVGGMRISTEPPQDIKDIHFRGANSGPTPRTALCPCGSGKKYKRCHGLAA